MTLGLVVHVVPDEPGDDVEERARQLDPLAVPVVHLRGPLDVRLADASAAIDALLAKLFDPWRPVEMRGKPVFRDQPPG